jgi:hypothetical protein
MVVVLPVCSSACALALREGALRGPHRFGRAAKEATAPRAHKAHGFSSFGLSHISGSATDAD